MVSTSPSDYLQTAPRALSGDSNSTESDCLGASSELNATSSDVCPSTGGTSVSPKFLMHHPLTASTGFSATPPPVQQTPPSTHNPNQAGGYFTQSDVLTVDSFSPRSVENSISRSVAVAMAAAMAARQQRTEGYPFYAGDGQHVQQNTNDQHQNNQQQHFIV